MGRTERGRTAVLCLLLLCCLCLRAPLSSMAEEAAEEPAEETGGAACALTLFLDGAEEDESHVWHLPLNRSGSLRFTWTAEGAADRFTAQLTGPAGLMAETETAGREWRVSQANLDAAGYRLTVTAWLGTERTGSASLWLLLGDTSTEPAKDADTAEAEGADGSAHRAAGRGGRGGRSGGSGGITPGKALTSAHAPGSGDLLPYDAVALTLPDAPAETLVLGGTALAVTCGGASVLPVLEGDSLILTAPEAAQPVWRAGLDALDTLRRSGVRTLVLTGAEDTLTVATAWEPAGPDYARERARGLVAEDFALVWDGGEAVLTVEDRTYSLEAQPPLSEEENP